VGLTILWAVLQSASIPCGVKIMGGWFNRDRGTIFGIWATNGVVGNLLGLGIISAIAAIPGESFTLMLILPGALMAAVGVLQLSFLYEGPFSVKNGTEAAGPPPDLFQTLALPGVMSYAATYALVKTVDTSIFFWIVLYLTKGLGFPESQAALIAMAYDGAQIFGSLIGGRVSDRVGTRSGVFFFMLAASSLCTFGIVTAQSWQVLLPVIFSIGLTTGGPCMLMHTAIAADVSSRTNKAATAMVTGIIDGTGSFAASAGQIAIGYVSQSSWTAVFLLLACTLAASSLMTLYIWFTEAANKKREPTLPIDVHADEADSPLIKGNKVA